MVLSMLVFSMRKTLIVKVFESRHGHQMFACEKGCFLGHIAAVIPTGYSNETLVNPANFHLPWTHRGFKWPVM